MALITTAIEWQLCARSGHTWKEALLADRLEGKAVSMPSLELDASAGSDPFARAEFQKENARQ